MRARVPMAPPSATARPADVVAVEDAACFVLAVVDLDAGRLSRDDRDLMGAARHLADALGGGVVMTACLPPATAFLAKPERHGADRVALLRHEAYADEMAEPRVAGILAVAQACAARHILLSGSVAGAELGRRVAARLDDRAAFDVRRLSGDGLLAETDAGLTEVGRPLPRVIVTASGAFGPVPSAPMREARALEVRVPASRPGVRSLGALPLDPATVPLGEAELIIGAGSGLTDWASFHEAAAALGAAEAGSRVVCDAGLLPRSRQVGASGLLVEPRCYMAFGIAGASQHLQGIAGAERVIAVNTDPRCDMIKRADLAIVADAQAVLPALVRRAALRGRTSEADDGAKPPPPLGPTERPESAGFPPREAEDTNGRHDPHRARSTAARPDVVALVSLGRHPVSKRLRRADLDARALELALGCSPDAMALHAGPAGAREASVLRDYIGLGAARLVILDSAEGSDPLPVVEAELRRRAPRLIVAGARAEAGECSGMTPFWLAERLGYALATNIVGLDLHGETIRLIQALPGGKRRALEAVLPLIVTVNRAAPEPRLGARMRALRGEVEVRPGTTTGTAARPAWSSRPSRPRPKRLGAPKAIGQGAASDPDARRALIAPDSDAAADAILDFLCRDGLVPHLAAPSRTDASVGSLSTVMREGTP